MFVKKRTTVYGQATETLMQQENLDLQLSDVFTAYQLVIILKGISTINVE